ncbi:MAG: ComF family protein [Acidobacteriota bacterium]|nr:ComF family protein [Acidobacteriota bacterium]
MGAEPGCPVCGLVIPSALANREAAAPTGSDPSAPVGLGCPNRWCRLPSRSFSVVYSLGRYEGALRRAITRYKYRGDRSLATVFARMVLSYLEQHAAWFEEVSVITAVPAYTGPGARRGWDHMGALLAEMATASPGWWPVEAGLVVKTRDSPPMAGRSWSERQTLASGPLRRALRGGAAPLAGTQVLLIDDVMAEGSTLNEVARALRRSGASDVTGLVLARAGWSPVPPVASAPGRGGLAAAAASSLLRPPPRRSCGAASP